MFCDDHCLQGDDFLTRGLGLRVSGQCFHGLIKQLFHAFASVTLEQKVMRYATWKLHLHT